MIFLISGLLTVPPAHSFWTRQMIKCLAASARRLVMSFIDESRLYPDPFIYIYIYMSVYLGSCMSVCLNMGHSTLLHGSIYIYIYACVLNMAQ